MKYYMVDTFTDEVFGGNPAGVCILDRKISPEIMQRIAKEHNLPETAFVLKEKNQYSLRWFTPKFEIDLCGHATLASSFILMNYFYKDMQKVTFSTQSGIIEVIRSDDKYEMSLPIRKPKKIDITEEMKTLLGVTPEEVASSRDLIVLLSSEEEVANYIPNYDDLSKLSDWLGIVITAKGKKADFVSRYFCPELKDEDPVTGSSHCSLVPYWSERLGCTKLYAQQLSERKGELYCNLEDDCVKVAGTARLYMVGEINI